MHRLAVATVIAILLAACSTDDDGLGIEIVTPTAGTTISTPDPIVFALKIHGDLHPGEADISVDGTRVPPSQVQGACINDNGSSQVTWLPLAIANGLHEVEVICVYDLSDYGDKVTLNFAQP